jgi:hypothetical protein
MPIRSRRREKEGVSLEDMSDDELQEIRFFGNLYNAAGALTYRATEAEQKRATEILKERGGAR